MSPLYIQSPAECAYRADQIVSKRRKNLSPIKIVRYWKDEEYRLSLSEAARALMPEDPARMINLDDAELDNAELDLIAGGPATKFSPTQIR